ncbi:hypothetical protein VNO77_22456 [Canavalia gladiata]|uniref:Uncharacterized protein n=1 Tax=Canavalia gladiata TaxID=3824 RepID=A0AAN9QAT4_CANGL
MGKVRWDEIIVLIRGWEIVGLRLRKRGKVLKQRDGSAWEWCLSFFIAISALPSRLIPSQRRQRLRLYIRVVAKRWYGSFDGSWIYGCVR